MTLPETNSSGQPERPIRARVPDHVVRGVFSTGVIVVTGQTEVVLDFVQNLGRPHQIVARVVMPHSVLPQLVDALSRNMELYRQRWGELPRTGPASAMQLPWTAPRHPQQQSGMETSQFLATPGHEPTAAPHSPVPQAGASGPSTQNSAPAESSAGDARAQPVQEPGQGTGQTPPSGPGAAAVPPTNTTPPDEYRPSSAQEIYDDLKIRDDLLSGAYANAVMIGHGAHEFSFDFITNFYPHSAVSARVFLAAGQIPRLYDSLRASWEQLRRRLQGPGNPPPGPSSP